MNNDNQKQTHASERKKKQSQHPQIVPQAGFEPGCPVAY